MSLRKVVVLGGGAAGMSAASRVRKLLPNTEVEVFERTYMVSHAPCAVPYFVEGLFSDTSLFMTYTPQFFEEKRKIKVNVGTEVEELDLKNRTVKVRKEGYARSVEYDTLIVALGARPKMPFRGLRVFAAHHPFHAMELREALWAASTVAVVGAGILGLEMAEALVERGKKVYLIHRGKYPLSRTVDQEIGEVIGQRVRESGVDFRPGEALKSVDEEGKIVVTDGGKYRVDATVLAVGVEPDVTLVKGKLPIGPTGALVVDQHMRTAHPDVYGAGDVAESKNLITGAPDWQPFAPVANKMGYVAGSNVGGMEMVFPGTVGTVVTKFKDLVIAKVGLTELEAKRAGLRTITSFVKAKTRARYYPGGKDIFVKLVAAEDGRVLGAQVAGGEEVLGRVNTVAAALEARMTVEQLFFVEMGYLPAVSVVWDPIVIAARQIMESR
ncbi:CoA-disulfide reductase [Sulfodiicoccus acidiphilus]|uniref:CoA-disulfide reductase n=1 Tax=Sulfodiicoccus acidiphilus TaxID=1670455 RepID=A0A348B6G5_9CREN|nr:FAD-dependent oxidoreductase [Sulfodiicoccus acidiphilus]BBD73767.1 CoA-disulfide reductase [Sulfodiicoccus acidiphilus]GGT98199.1 CoA-disulfide reductase [Sulfodiicoccus acidiphilus]